MSENAFIPHELRCESLLNPIGIGRPAPCLSWVLQAACRGLRQSAYQVLVASSPEVLANDVGDLWDSGKVVSDASFGIEYAGASLAANQTCFWKVRVWDETDSATTWSDMAQWSVGLLQAVDWQGQWVAMPANASPAATSAGAGSESGGDSEPTAAVSPWLRKTFTLEAVPGRALVYVNAIGYFELHVNGRKVGGDVLSPAVSVLKRRTWVLAYDVGSFLQPGRNAIGLWLGRGWNAKTVQGHDDERPRARLQCHLQFTDSTQTMVSDATWKCRPSPYTTLGPWAWNKYGGERYDARLENPDWCHSRLDDDDWSSVEVLPAPGVAATAQACPVNRVGKQIAAVRCTDLGEGRFELDFGTALSGWLQMIMPQLPEARRVKFYYADWRYATANPEDELTPAGIIKSSCSDILFPDKNGGTVRYQVFNQVDEFVAGGGLDERFCGKFNYHGFRYVVVEGLPVNPGPACAMAELIEADLETTGDFACSNELLNRIHQLNLWTIRCLNLGGYIVDCPHRERLGYGDGQVSIQTSVMNWRMDKFYAKWLQDWIDTQNHDDGALPFSTPYHPPTTGTETEFGREAPPAWGGTMPVLAWNCALYYDDRMTLAAAYEPMRRFMERLESHTVSDILRGYGDVWQRLGDWVPPGGGLDNSDNWPSQPANDLFNNCYRLYLWELLAKSAESLGRGDQAMEIRRRNEQLRPIIHDAFYDAQGQCYVNEEQTSLVMPLVVGVVPDHLRDAMIEKLESSLTVRRQGHLDTGMLGTHFLIHFLNAIGRDDLLYAVVNHSSYPGWGYMLAQGATTMWEQWNGYWSRIHSCFTSIAGWFHAGLAGIQPDPAVPGFKRIIIHPALVGDLEWVRCRHRCNYGIIESNWRRDGDRLEMEVVIPPNTTATVYVPANDSGSVTEGGVELASAQGVREVRAEHGRVVCEIGSGRYCFSTRVATQ